MSNTCYLHTSVGAEENSIFSWLLISFISDMIRFTAEPRLLMAANNAFYQSQQLALMGGGITSYVLRREPPQPSLLSMTNARTPLSSRGCVGLTKDFRAEWNVCELSRLDWLRAERRCDEDAFHGKGRFQVLQSSENDNVIAKGIVRYSVWQRIGLSIFSTTETRYT